MWLAILIGTAAFALGVWLAPVLRGDYASFKAYVEPKLKDAEQVAKSKAVQVAKSKAVMGISKL